MNSSQGTHSSGARFSRLGGKPPPPRLSFPRRRRLRGRKAFRAVFEHGEKRRDGNLVLYVLANNFPYSRLGIVVSKRSHGKRAVDRNRVKRLVREAFRLTQNDIAAGVDIICIPLPTRRRPRRLESLIRSFKRLLRPEKPSTPSEPCP